MIWYRPAGITMLDLYYFIFFVLGILLAYALWGHHV